MQASEEQLKTTTSSAYSQFVGVVSASDWYAGFYRKGKYEFEPIACFAISIERGGRWADAFSGVGLDGQASLLGIENTDGVEGDDDFVGYAHASDFEVVAERLKANKLALFDAYLEALGRRGT